MLFLGEIPKKAKEPNPGSAAPNLYANNSFKSPSEKRFRTLDSPKLFAELRFFAKEKNKARP